MTYGDILLDKADGTGWITLNRPGVLNALSIRLFEEMGRALDDIGADDSVGVAVLTGAGRAFSAGVDIKTVDEAGKPVSPPKELALAVIAKIESLAKPVIAAVNGFCLTGALELVTACDMIIASENAVFGDTHARWGLTPVWGGSQRLPRIVGPLRAKEMFFTGESLTAAQAERAGLVNRVVPADALVETVRQTAARILANSREAMAIEKALVNRGMKLDYASGLALEAEISPGRVSDAAARLESFGGRRKPDEG
jgi:enoyl-CoA hydratase/carnithine racemase